MNNYYSSSDSEDDEPPRKRRVFRARINFHFEDRCFLERFRISKTVFEQLYSAIGEKFWHPTDRNYALTPEQQLLISLHFLGTGCQYHSVGDMHGVSKSTVHRCVIKFSKVVVDELFGEHVKWPENADSVATGFYRYSGIPNVAGSMDGTLINIIKPKQNEEQFLDRHGNHSINAMMICRYNLKFNYVNARFPGSVHDARVLRNSNVFQRFEEGWRPFPGAIIIADSAYPLKDWLIPYRPPRPDCNTEERLYKSLQRSRHLVECAYGVLKNKFPCLKYLRLDPEIAAYVIMTCSVLHNMCIDQLTQDDLEALILDLGDDEIEPGAPEDPGDGRSKGLDDLLRFFQAT